ncbi:hypothetical protein WJX73_004812 [Symbiochloris irregularis]|uniref:C2H2-type domain-containing protein n=1 Tax=Symbiochloris irregularis TaxID=706552 RepID=A0AAW1P4G8_9CHLO
MTEVVEPDFPGFALNLRRANRPDQRDNPAVDWSSVKVPPAFCRPCKRRFNSQQTLLQHERDSARHAHTDEAAAAILKLEAYAKHKDHGHAFCCVCWLSFETTDDLLQHLSESADHTDSDSGTPCKPAAGFR